SNSVSVVTPGAPPASGVCVRRLGGMLVFKPAREKHWIPAVRAWRVRHAGLRVMPPWRQTPSSPPKCGTAKGRRVGYERKQSGHRAEGVERLRRRRGSEGGGVDRRGVVTGAVTGMVSEKKSKRKAFRRYG